MTLAAASGRAAWIHAPQGDMGETVGASWARRKLAGEAGRTRPLVDFGRSVSYPASDFGIVHVSATSLLDRRLLLFTGKGGVGKTTLVAALAIEAARRGRRPLIVELGHRASMEAVFEVDSIGYEPVDVGRGVHAMNLDFESALADYFEEHIPVRRVARTIMRNKTLQKFFHAAPSVPEVATLNKIGALEAERGPGGGYRWDPIFVDL
ncbi:MAG: hypothetical protein KC668_30970, partial [Myxococcales bacterium]|nr:hypothetical protein [Myxococcales bacterium]